MKKTPLILFSSLILLLTACNSSKFEGYKKADNGLHYKFYVQNDSSKAPEEGDFLAFRYVIKKYSNDSLLVDSKQVSRNGTGVVAFPLPKPSFVGSIEDGLKMMRKGDSASFIICADSFFLKTSKMNALPPSFKPGEFLTVYVRLVNLQTKKEYEDIQRLQQAEIQKDLQRRQMEETPLLVKYLGDNKINVKPTKSGLIYIEEKKGTGEPSREGDKAIVNYRGTLLDGTEFDNSYAKGEPITVEVAQNMVIPGWDEALQIMNKGAKAKLIIPSNLGYGQQGNGGIPPFATLIFTIEIVDIKQGAAR